MRLTPTRGTALRSALILPTLALLLLTLPATMRAQSFSGTGQQATQLFSLPEGLAVFELSHQGDGEFVVQLLDSDGKAIGELAHTRGDFEGSKALRIESSGRYLLDVRAGGPWSVRLRDGAARTGGVAARSAGVANIPAGVTTTDSATAATALAEGRAAGIAAAGRGSAKWGIRGLLGGTLAGPVGLGLAVHYAGRSDITAPPPPAAADASFSRGFREGFETRARLVRRKSAFIGGMVGTAIFTSLIIYLADFSGDGTRNQGNNGNPELGIAR